MSGEREETVSAAKLALTINRMRSEQPGADLLFSEPIAVVGIGCRLPGGIHTPDEYWQFLHHGGDAIHEVPFSRWDAGRYFHPDLHSEGKMNTRWGGFLGAVDEFDPSFFGISPREAAAMDPQQRLALEVAWEALWDAGVAPDGLAGSSTGVFLGVYGTDYARLLLDDPRAIGSHTCVGAAHSMASGRIAFLLDLHGPAITIDTACSSSLVAIHLACQSLRAGSCRAAFAGGVSLKLRPEHYLCLSKLGMTSPDGRCHTFDAGSNGFVPGEGCGIVLLKPFADALAEKCRIYAVIRGGASNQDGRTNALTAPSGLAQQAVIHAALSNARIKPSDISYIETHGTGTPLGDPIEVEALAETIGRTNFGSEACALGAVKSNFGHLEAAAGVTGLIKAVLALHHEEIPPNLHYKKPNPHLTLEGTRFFVPTAPTPWPRGVRARFAGVSAFGFSGTNAHIILEEAPRMPARPTGESSAEPRSWLLPISARTPEACEAFARSWRGFLGGAGRNLPLYEISHSASMRRGHYEERLALMASSTEEMTAQLDAWLIGRTLPGVARGRDAHDTKPIVFVFSGQGSQWPRMGLQLYTRFSAFRAALDACDEEIRRAAGWSVQDILSAADRRLDRTEYAQPALFAVEVALAQLWQSWGIRPAAVVGHSIGEIAGAHVAGALTLATAARLAVLRSRLMESAAGRGRMAVLYQSPEEVKEALVVFGDALSIACINSPRCTVVSGEPEAIEAMVALQRDRNVSSRHVQVEYAFHSAQMQLASEALLRELGTVAQQPATIPMLSTVTGSRVKPGDLSADYWARNVRQPVLFADAIRIAAGENESAVFVEVGPHPVLLDSIAETLKSSSTMLVPSLRRGADEAGTMLTSLGKLYVAGCPVAWDKLYTEPTPPVTLPLYPFQRQRLWVETRGRRPASDERPLAIHAVRSPELAKPAFETKIGLEALPWLADHRIADETLLPMTAFVEIARRAVEAAGRPFDALQDFAILEPLALPAQEMCTVQVILQGGLLQIFSLVGDVWTLHATCRSTGGAKSVRETASTETPYGSVEAHYRLLAEAGADFGPAFCTVRALSASDGRACARVRLGDPERVDADAYLFHPALLDGCLQSVLATLPEEQRTTLFVPFGFSEFAVFGPVEAEIIASARRRPESTPDSVLADVNIHSGNELVACISGLRMNRQRDRNRIDPRIFSIHMQETARGAPLPSAAGSWVILSEDAAAAQGLASALMRLGCTVLLRPASAPLELTPKLRAIVRLFEAATDFSLDAAVAACTSTLAIVSGLLEQNAGDPPQLCLITRSAMAGSVTAQGGAPAQSAVLGLARTIAMEHPELRCVRIDTEGTENAWQDIAQDLVQWDGQEEIVHRGSRRYLPRLQRAPDRSLQLRRWKVSQPGSLENLSTETIARRAPAVGEVEVEVDASALNFRDVLTALGMYPAPLPPLGLEFCGAVTRIGEGVSTCRPGDRVAGIAWGSLSSVVYTPAALTFSVPTRLSNIEAVTVPNAFLTAQYCFELAELGRGQRVLIHAGTGGVGLAAVQLAQLAGAEIYATAGSDEKRAFLQRLGVRHVFNSRSLDFAREIAVATSGEGVDLILNSLAGEFIPAGFSILRAGGCFIEIGKNNVWSVSQAATHRPDCRYHLVDLAGVIEAEPEMIRRRFGEIRDLLESGSITPLPARVFSFDQAPTAFRLMSRAGHIGKVVLRHSGALHISGERTYLITGGLGAIGISAAHWLTRLGARHLLLIGRSAPSPGVEEMLRKLETDGVRINVRRADVAARDELAVILEEMGHTMPPLAGILHAAGVLDDGMLEQQTPERLRRVIAPKAAGAWNLHELTAGMPLDFFFFFSSLASVTGSPSQAGYSAANAWMDALAQERHRRGLPGLSINWGAWSGAGMAAAVDAQGKRRSLPWLHSMGPEESWKCLEEAVYLGGCQVVIADADWRSWVPMPSMLTELIRSSNGPVNARSAEPKLRARLTDTPVRNRRVLLLEHLRGLVRQILGLTPTHFVDDREPLIRMGLDSLMAVELRNQISAALERPLMATLLFDHPTLADLAAFLLGEDSVNERDYLLEEVKSLSDAEAEALLKHELEHS